MPKIPIYRNRKHAYDTENRFWARVKKVGDCWVFMGARSYYGHGLVTIFYKNTCAHRYAYELLKEPIPKGLHLDHLCRNPPCVNPDHLEPVTHRENILRGYGFGGINSRKTHCPRGHEFTEKNIFRRPGIRKNQRGCRSCAVRWSTLYFNKNKEIIYIKNIIRKIKKQLSVYKIRKIKNG